MKQWEKLEAIEQDPDKVSGPGSFGGHECRLRLCLKICAMGQRWTSFWSGFLV